jgi:hypothetical protein
MKAQETKDQQIDISKASGGIAALVDAVGLEQAVTSVMNAAQEQLNDTEKESVIREIFVQQLGRASDAVKTGGLSPEVIQLLQQLLALMAPQQAAPPDAPGAPDAGQPPMEQSAKAEDEEAKKALPSPQGDPMASGGMAPQKDAPPNSPQKKGDDEEAKKALPSAQKDAPLQSPQGDPMASGGMAPQKKEESEKGALPTPQADPGPDTIQAEQGINTPQQKNDPWAWSRSGDLGRKEPPKPKIYGYGTR